MGKAQAVHFSKWEDLTTVGPTFRLSSKSWSPGSDCPLGKGNVLQITLPLCGLPVGPPAFFFSCDARGGTQSLVLTRHVLYH